MIGQALVGASIAIATVAAAATPAPMPRVVLVRPAAAPASVSEALVRMRGELLAAGFDAEVMDLPLGADVRASLERLAPPSAAGKSTTALVAVVPSPDPGMAELWVIDRVTGKTVVRRVSAPPAADPNRVAEILAVRAVELLRASFLELAIAPPAAETGGMTEATAPAPAAPVIERWATAPMEERDWTWAIEAGGGTAKALQGPWNQFLPVARLERAFGPRLCVRLAFAGLGTAARVPADSGSVDVSQTVMLAEIVIRFRHGHWLEPLISIGGGALRVAETANLTGRFQGVDGARWGAAGDLGVGLRIPLRRHRFQLGAEVHALLAQPYPTINYFDQELGRTGRPTVLGTVTLLGGI